MGEERAIRQVRSETPCLKPHPGTVSSHEAKISSLPLAQNSTISSFECVYVPATRRLKNTCQPPSRSLHRNILLKQEMCKTEATCCWMCQGQQQQMSGMIHISDRLTIQAQCDTNTMLWDWSISFLSINSLFNTHFSRFLVFGNVFLLTNNILQYFLTLSFCVSPGDLAWVLPSTPSNKRDADTVPSFRREDDSISEPCILHVHWHIDAASEVDQFSNKHQFESRILVQCQFGELV